VAAIAPEHVQAIRPVRPARRVRRNRVRERALWREERERQGRRDERGAWRSDAPGIEWGRAIRGSDFGDERNVKALGQVLKPAAHGELGRAVDIVQVLQAVVLQRQRQQRPARFNYCGRRKRGEDGLRGA
jgi:hypothetical protein